MANISALLISKPHLTATDLNGVLADLKSQPADQAKAQLDQLLQAGEARLPENGASKIRDFLFALQADRFDPAQGPAKRPAPASIKSSAIEAHRAMDGAAVPKHLTLAIAGKAAPGSQVRVINLSRPEKPQLGNVRVGDDGKLNVSLTSDRAPFVHGDRIGVVVIGPNGGMSDTAVISPESIEVQTWKSGSTKRVKQQLDRSAPPINAQQIANQHTAATPDDPAHHLLLTGKAGATEPFAKLEMVVAGKTQKTTAAADGSFYFDVSGVEPGRTYPLRVIDDAGLVKTANFRTPPLQFDGTALSNASQGVPYDRMVDGKPDAAGPFLRFAAANVATPFSTITITNHSTGKSVTAEADANGRVDVELAGVHAGDALSFSATDPAGFAAPGALRNWAVPGAGQANPRVTELLCAQTLRKAEVDELIALLRAEPTSVHRAAVASFLAETSGVIQNRMDFKRLGDAVTQVFSGANNVVTQDANPAPKEPIVINAKCIKPRVMDSGNARGADPLEVSGTAEPFSTVEIRNASQPNAPVIGSVQADANGEFKFVSTNESLFLHGDQLFVRARDQGGAESKAALAHTCAYELRIWNATNRRELVKLPQSTDTRPPFFDAGKIQTAMQPITSDASEQVFTVRGAALSAEPESIVRVTNRRGEVYETQVGKDGSFALEVGGITPGETLKAITLDAAGRTASQAHRTPALQFDSAPLLASSQGAPFARTTRNGRPSSRGPFLHFSAPAAVDPHAVVKVTNNSTGKSFTVHADDQGKLDFEISQVHSGDSLAFAVFDPAGNAAPGAIANYVVPGEAQVSQELQDLDCQHTFLAEHVDQLVQIIEANPSAANRAIVDGIAARTSAFDPAEGATTLSEALGRLFKGRNDVRLDTENPAPKMPIVIDAQVIKPRIMDGGNRRVQDPLEVTGKAEPFSTVEIRNASQPNAPVIGTVQADKNGAFKFVSTNESLFLHGDQLLLKAIDQGGKASKSRQATTCAYELQVWNNPPRTEKVELPATTDTRPPFLDMAKVAHQRAAIAPDGDEQLYVISSQALGSEPNAIVRVTNSQGEAYEAKVKQDGSFELKVGNHRPGETLKVTVLDVNGRVLNQTVRTPALIFDAETFTNTSEGVPYRRAAGDADQPASNKGPFLSFGPATVDPHSILEIKNNSTGETFRAQADADGKLAVEISNVHVGDSLAFNLRDPAGNPAPRNVTNFVVPGEPRHDPRLEDITCQRMVLSEHVDELIKLLQDQPTAAHRGLVRAWLADDHTTFNRGPDKNRLETMLGKIFKGERDVVSDTSNPVPKDPIVVDARVIKPRAMDQGSVQNRDPLEVSGRAEPFSTVEVRNASQPNAPVIGTVQADANGEFKFVSTNEQLFLHGDQLLVRAVDQGRGTSGDTLVESCAYELRVWNRQNRTELVRLPDATDTRPPFLDAAKIANSQTLATAASPHTFTTITGQPRSAEPNSIVRVQTSSGKVCEAKVGADGSFTLKATGYRPGETLKAICTDVNGRVCNQSYKTEALRFDTNRLVAEVNGPPYQKLVDGEVQPGGPYLQIHAADVAFPGAVLKVTNHATGRVESFTADEQGGFDLELSRVHAHDLLTFQIEDAAGNAAPSVLRAWEVPVEAEVDVDPRISALTRQRPLSESHVKELIDALRAAPTAHHRALVETLLHEHPNWFVGDAAKVLKGAVAEIFRGPPEIQPDTTNPRPQMPIVLGSEIIKPRVMDRGNPPQDPLKVEGLAEPLSTVEIYNGSVPGRPLIGTVRADAEGKFAFTSTDESKFLHGDQIVVQAMDAGGAKSDAVASSATAFELRIWNAQNRREKVALGPKTDTRDPFVQANLLATERVDGTAQSGDNFVVVGKAGATETFATVEIQIGDQKYAVEAALDGSFRLPVPELKLGERIQVLARDANGRAKQVNYTPAVA